MPRAARGEKRARKTKPEERSGLRAFVTDFFAAAGCQTSARNGEIAVTLTPEMEALFGAPALRLAFQAHDLMDPDVHLLQPGSVLLEKMVAHLRDRVGVALAEAPAAVPAESALPPEIEFACEAHLNRVDVEPEEYVTFHFRLGYTCDEKNEEVLAITVDGEGQPTDDPELLARLAAAEAREGEIETSRRALGTLYAEAEARARRHAEETATRYERETLPRLHREISRLRAFYNAQIMELDPQNESDQDLRDHYERELRLRTEEEVQNHRMVVSVSLLNFRVTRLPRARYSIRLNRPHARRTAAIERDLSTGALLPPACEACQTPLTALDLCAGGHLVCPTCVQVCVECRRPVCAACGVQICAHCDRPACADCRVTCAVCKNVVCLEHSAVCPHCQRKVCVTCLGECAVCHTPQCAAHLEACGTCGEPACAQCRETCARCGGSFCTRHTTTCVRCGQIFCAEHVGECAECGARRCHGDLQACVTCEKPLCEAHARACGGCGAPVCAEHAGGCSVCGAGICSACGAVCAMSGVALCPAHVVVCSICGLTVGEEYAAECHQCGARLCGDHMTECARCGKMACPTHQSDCRVCEEPLCGECAGAEGTCATCASPELGEEVPATEVARLQGMPGTWQARVLRARWRRQRRRDGVIYYGSRLFRLIVVLADSEGRYLRARELSLVEIRGLWGAR